MQILAAPLTDVVIIEPKIYSDIRGFLFENFNRKRFFETTGITPNFVQDIHSRSSKGVLRGLHYQIKHPQGKLIHVVSGSIFDVVVDVRKSSPNFGRWFGIELSQKNHRHLWAPAGFAHGFLVLSESADVLYKTTDYWYPEHECRIRWNDATIGINWPLKEVPTLSDKDHHGKSITEVEVFA
jgi:dTDP-4-dehydrorhamnose 3,5-epimerase